MKGKKKRKASLSFIIFTILIPLLFLIPTAWANSQISISFDPRPNESPARPINIYPSDGATDIEIPVTLQVSVYDESSSTVDVYFYNGLDNASIGVDYDVSADWSTAMVIWSGLQYETNYSWYVVVNDSEYENASETWIFATRPNQPSIIYNNEYPQNASTNIEVSVTCHIEVSDEDADLMTIYWYENSTGSWILRQTNASVGNGTYYWTFSQASSYSTTYYWKVAVNDSIANTTAVYYFTTKPQPSAPPSSPPSSPPNQKPVANITGPLTGYVNQTLLFSAQHSYDPDGIITHYRWDFDNDGLFDTDWIEDILVAHTYSCPGNYTVKLQVKDNDGAISTDSYIILIKQLEPPLQLPVAQANGPYMSFTNENITFNSTGSYDPDGTIVNYTWDFGDKNTSHMENPIHSYAKQGNYIVFLTVVDNDNLSNTAIASIYIRDPEPEEEKEQPILLILFMAITATLMPVLILKSKRRRRQIYYYMRNKLNNVHNIELKVDELLSGLNNKNNKEIKKEKLRNHRNPREKLEQSLRKRR